MAVQTNDITALLKQQILDFKPVSTQVDVGEVVEVGDGIALVSGLQNAMAGELVEFTKTGTLAIAAMTSVCDIAKSYRRRSSTNPVMWQHTEPRRRPPIDAVVIVNVP